MYDDWRFSKRVHEVSPGLAAASWLEGGSLFLIQEISKREMFFMEEAQQKSIENHDRWDLRIMILTFCMVTAWYGSQRLWELIEYLKGLLRHVWSWVMKCMIYWSK